MPAYRPYPMHVALCELGFAVTAFGCGLFHAPIWAAGLASLGLLAYWNLTRRAWLDRLRVRAWAALSLNASLVLIAITGGAYWLGLGI